MSTNRSLSWESQKRTFRGAEVHGIGLRELCPREAVRAADGRSALVEVLRHPCLARFLDAAVVPPCLMSPTFKVRR